MLKKLTLALCVSSLLGGVAFASSGSASGSIKFIGSVSHQAPSVLVKFGDTTSALNNSPTQITLSDCYAAELDGGAFNNDKAKHFQIIIQRYQATGYNHVTSATLTLTATAGVENGVMKVDAGTSNAATNVGVGLRYLGTNMADTSGVGNPVFNGAINTKEITGNFQYAEVDPTFDFKAALQQIDSGKVIGDGEVASTLTVNLTYQ